MKRSVYLETTIISYLAAKPSRDLIVAGHQQLTRQWWEEQRSACDVFISEAVLQEIKVGDKDAATRRLELVDGLAQLEITDEIISFADRIAKATRLPPRARADALHVAAAAVNRLDILLTWNCKHLAGATFRPLIEAACRTEGVEPPVICTPFELLEQ